MASGSGARARGSRTRDYDVLLDEELASRPAVDLIAHLNRHRTSQYAFVGVSLVLHERERRFAEAEDRIRATDEVVDALRGELSTVRDELSAAITAMAEIHRAEEAEARLRAEMEEWRRRAIEAEARLQTNRPAREELPGLGGEARDEGDPMATATELQADTSARGSMAGAQMEGVDCNVPPPCSLNRVASPTAPALDEDDPMDEETEVGLVDVADLSSNGEDALVEEGHREGASEVVSCKRKEFLALPEDKEAQENEDVLVNVHALAVISPEQVVPETLQEARADDLTKASVTYHGPETRRSNQKPVWKLNKSGMFYKMVAKALKEKEMEKAASAPPDNMCWLNAPRSSRSVNM